MNGHLGVAGGRDHADVGSAEQPPGTQDGIPGANLLTGRPDVVPKPHRLGDRNAVVVERVDVLEADDGVGARRDRRAGHDADGAAGFDGDAGPMPRACLPDDVQLHRRVLAGVGGVGRDDRVAVHGGIVERRQVGACGDVRREDQPERIAEWQLNRWDGCDRSEDPIPCLVHANRFRAAVVVGVRHGSGGSFR